MSRVLLTLFLLCHLTFVFTQPTNATSSTSTPTTNITTTPTPTPTPTVKPNNVTTNTTTSNTTTTGAPTSTPTQMANATTATPTNASSTTAPPSIATTATPTTVSPTTATPTTPDVVTTSAPTNAATTATPTTATPTTSAPTVVSSSSSTGIGGGGIISNPTTTSPTLANKASTSSKSFTELYITPYETYYYIGAGIVGGIIIAIICGLYIKRRLRIQRVMKSSQHHVRGTCDLPGVDLDLETGENVQQEITASPLSSLDKDGHHRAQTESIAVSITSYGEIEGNISGIRKRQSEAEEARVERRRTRQESVQPIEETHEQVMPHRPSESQDEREARIESRRATPLPSYV